MNVFASRLLWSGPVRIGMFWAIAAGVFWQLATWIPPLDGSLILTTLAEVSNRQMDGVASQEFAFAVATALFVSAIALAVAFSTCGSQVPGDLLCELGSEYKCLNASIECIAGPVIECPRHHASTGGGGILPGLVVTAHGF
jgi:hypothetical protein